ncbi:hypothetical protein BDV30DRAFT_241828 [Aspergillus minisclerotigenes]|uniref:Uncharacterized protein n=1 Tax=Aspergillus minisclerotigenes TaxID=656917 RepID=A0A5N6ITR7_9EURO|nr:hypothetical protein BDV30DRAFT_241828 [Aspergillus minisclerotigenes]
MAETHPGSSLNIINLVTQCLCIPIVTLFVVTRFFIRCWYKQFLVVEDTFCFLAWAGYSTILRVVAINCLQILFMVYCSIAIVVGRYGGGVNYLEVPAAMQVNLRKVFNVAAMEQRSTLLILI